MAMADVPQRSHVIVRPAWSCTSCARKKIKCDKEIPCGNCIKRGVGQHCTRDDDSTRVQSAAAVSESSNLRDDLRSVLNRLERMERQMSNIANAGSIGIVAATSEDDTTPLASVHASTSSAQSENTSVTLEYLALGKNRRLGILGGSRDPYTSTASTDIALQSRHNLDFPHSAKERLSSDRTIKRILRHHSDAVLWQHACVHSQTFQRQLNHYLSLSQQDRWRYVDPLWLALMLSIATITIHQMPEIVFSSIFADTSLNRQEIVDDTLAATLRCLELGNYMARPAFYTCQTIAILSVCGHNVVDSNLLASLLAVGIKTAQMLNLHILGADQEVIGNESLKYLAPSPAVEEAEAGAWRQRLVSFEMGKRVWWSLVQQDYFAIPFRGVSLVNFRQHDTPFPSNTLDIDLDQGLLHTFDDDYPSLTLKQRITSMSSDVLCRFFDHLPRQDASWQNDVQPFETEFMRLLPAQRSVPLASDRAVPYMPSLKAYLEISVRHKMLVMHRAFCGRKPTEQADVTRSKAVCVDMARGILIHCKSLTHHEEGPMMVMWTTAYHAMAAATVLALDMFALSASASAASVRRMEVEEAKSVLESMSRRSPIAIRGVTLLASLLLQFDEATRTNIQVPPRHSPCVTSEHPDHSPLKRSRTAAAGIETNENSDWNWEDWEQYQSIVTMLQANPDVGRLFDGTLGNPFE